MRRSMIGEVYQYVFKAVAPLLVGVVFACTWGGAASEAEARRRFKPFWGFSLSGGTTFYRGTKVEADYKDQALSHGIFGAAVHHWIHPVISLDLALDAHVVTKLDSGEGFGYLGFKPGIRIRLWWFYIRPALHLAVGKHEQGALFGGLLGLGFRVPLGRVFRIFIEANWNFLFGRGYFLPFNGKLGFEFVFPQGGHRSI